MARFASQYRNYIHGAQTDTPKQEVIDADGRPAVLPGKKLLEAIFDRNLVTPPDILAVKARLKFTGTVEDEGGREIDPAYRVAVFDSELAKLRNGWTDAEEQLVVDKLRNSGRNGQDFVEIVADPILKPWPGYDDVDSPERVVEIALAIEVDLAQVIAYEKENRNDEAVISALEEASEAKGETVIVQA